MKSILIILISLFLGCQRQIRQINVSTNTTHTINIDRDHLNGSSVYIMLRSATYEINNDLKSSIEAELNKKGYVLTNDYKNADIKLDIGIKNFTKIDDLTTRNINNYLIYSSIFDSTNASSNKSNLGISDVGIGFGNGKIDNSELSKSDKVSASAFAAGSALGAAVGFAICGPTCAVISGVGFGTATTKVTKSMEDVGYLAILDIKISHLLPPDTATSSQYKVITKLSTNATKETYFSHNERNIDHQTTLIVSASDHARRKDDVIQAISNTIAKSVANLF